MDIFKYLNKKDFFFNFYYKPIRVHVVNKFGRLCFSSFFLSLLCFFITPPAHSAQWVEVDVGYDSGDTYLWPYFYTASRFIDTNSISKKGDFIVYKELINSTKPISKNVKSLIVEKKSKCDGQRVLWKHFSIFASSMGEGKPIMSLNPNEMQDIDRGSSAQKSDSFVCNYIKN